MTHPRRRLTSRSIVGFALAILLGGCAGAASPVSSSSPTGTPLTETAAKAALFSRFGPLVYCDPDEYPVARADPMSAALAHRDEMRRDAAWPLIAKRLGIAQSSAPSGDSLLAAYRDWKMFRALALKPSVSGWSFDARFGGTAPDASQSSGISHVVGTIDADGTIHVTTQEESGPPPCPICLAGGTLIATPAGDMAVETLRPGDPVWTLDRLGKRVAAIVVQVGSMPVRVGHEVVRLVLGDGRAVLVSPGHPLLDGRTVAELRVGDGYDGAVVASVERVAYRGGTTFDLLPSGTTVAYWANGIKLGSTLFR